MAKKKAAKKKITTPKVRVDFHFKEKPKRVVDLFKKFSTMVRTCGPLKMRVTKSAIEFKRNRTFAVVWLSKDALEGVIDLYKAVKDRRFKRSEKTSRFVVSNTFKLRNKKQLNASFHKILEQSYRVGMIGGKTSLK